MTPACTPSPRALPAASGQASIARRPTPMHNACITAFCRFVSEIPPPAPSRTAPPHQPAAHWLLRWLLRGLAILCLGLGIAGVFIPGLPTTVFILIAGWAAARSSQRLHDWLWQHRLFGPMLENWSQGGTVSRRAKYSATIMMALCATVLWIAPTPFWVRWLACSCMAVVLVWLWCRPEPSAHEGPSS